MSDAVLRPGDGRCVYDFGPDTDREILLKAALADLDRRYREEAQPLLDELAREQTRKAPKVYFVPFAA